MIPLLAPTVTSGEVIRPRDRDGRVTAVVRTVAERRYSTAELLLAEHELLQRGRDRAGAGVAQVPARVVDRVVAGRGLDADQEAMVRAVTGSGAGVDVVVGKAGTGKTTAIDAAEEAFTALGSPVLGVAPTATAAHQLARATGMDTSTVDRLLVELEHGRTRLPRGVVVVLDKAGMCSTRNRLALQRAVDEVDGKVIDVGDDRQIPSVDVGGGFHALGTVLGASTLGVNHRFRDPQYRDAADLIWHGQPDSAIALLDAAGAVFEHDSPDVVHRRMVADWAQFRAEGLDARMFATTPHAVDILNDLARTQLVQAGQLPRRGGRTYTSPDGGRALEVRPGERVRLGANDYTLRQPDGTTRAVTNGMEGHITAFDRHGVTVQLDPEYLKKDASESPLVRLPAPYVGEHLRYGYAITADSAQGRTIDHGLYAPAGFGSLERGYVALTRGAISSRIYATTDNGWRTTLGLRAAHTPALNQQPDPDRLRPHLPRYQPTPVAAPQPLPTAEPVTSDARGGMARPPLTLVPPPSEPPDLDEPADDNPRAHDRQLEAAVPARELVPLPDPPLQYEGHPDLEERLDMWHRPDRREIDPSALAM